MNLAEGGEMTYLQQQQGRGDYGPYPRKPNMERPCKDAPMGCRSLVKMNDLRGGGGNVERRGVTKRRGPHARHGGSQSVREEPDLKGMHRVGINTTKQRMEDMPRPRTP